MKLSSKPGRASAVIGGGVCGPGDDEREQDPEDNVAEDVREEVGDREGVRG